MRRSLPVEVLIVLAPLVAEVLPGSTRITQPIVLLSDLMIYGPGVLLIRELVRRRGRGWPSILLLGAAYGLVEEGLALQSLFNPAYASASLWGARVFGINGIYTETVVVVHMVWSVAIPILLTDLLFPAQHTRPYLRRFGLVVTSIWFVLGVALVGFFARTTYPYEVPPALLGLTALIVLALAAIALGVLPRQASRSKLPVNAPRPWVVLLVTGIGAFVGLALSALLWRVQPAFARGMLVLIPMLGVLVVDAVMVWLIRNWVRARDWSDRHQLALASGALIAHSVVGSLLYTKTMVQSVTMIVLGLVMIFLLALFAIRIRGRVGDDVNPSVKSGTGVLHSTVNEEQPQALLNTKD